ncbi:hypothetical protein M747DRAFT_296425 [Aspergillus niger ATCC 13496]|uniref:Uncharacterized protein n=3 Tax=Aspergillus niger TaxID=5061 RepID=A2QFT4_ASPNC|nr:hypothetical protein An03g00690 [Aspergillus niger]RDH19619.1 hypothetical protein M747DRAFT_296425 [Aspergillus niger ATCC 13496]CAK38044.1 hypothetical protein An03g00690 [Aspergillus niger]|eukprot:XP_001389973.1 hypothetical protein ANI_1_76034 [Aspergillus niger CBS 513.88]
MLTTLTIAAGIFPEAEDLAPIHVLAMDTRDRDGGGRMRKDKTGSILTKPEKKDAASH